MKKYRRCRHATWAKARGGTCLPCRPKPAGMAGVGSRKPKVGFGCHFDDETETINHPFWPITRH